MYTPIVTIGAALLVCSSLLYSAYHIRQQRKSLQLPDCILPVRTRYFSSARVWRHWVRRPRSDESSCKREQLSRSSKEPRYNGL